MRDNKNRNSGFTLVEALITLAILVILLSVSAVGVARSRDHLKITELDNAARDIYMAAQNRAVLLQSSRRLNKQLTGGGVTPTGETGGSPCYISNREGNTDEQAAVLNELVPVGVIDPSLRENGEFYIVYDPETGSVTDVFYMEEKSSLPDIKDALDLVKGGDDRNARMNHDPMIGYYGGEAAADIGTKPLPAPGVEVLIENGEELKLTVTYTLPDSLPPGTAVTRAPVVWLEYGGEKITLLGNPTADAPQAGRLLDSRSGGDISSAVPGSSVSYTCVLDSLEKEGGAFKKQFKGLKSGSDFSALGDDFKVTAGLRLSADGYIESAYYAEGSDNSLFAKDSTYGVDGTALIANLRHLQNLCTAHSNAGGGIVKARQLCDIGCRGEEPAPGRYEFIPIENANLTSYDGGGKHICNLYAEDGDAVGLFGEVSSDLTVTDCRVCWNKPEALVGGNYIYAVSGKNAGGLIGSVTSGTVTISNSFAAATVKGTGTAGGLVGSVKSGAVLKIENSYADCYLQAGTVGGLIGKNGSSSVTLKNCYAAGFGLAAADKTAGLAGGTGTVTVTGGVYSVVRVINNEGKLERPGELLAHGLDNDANTRYLFKAADVTGEVRTDLGAGFQSAIETHIYNLRNKRDPSVAALKPPYSFPGLKDSAGKALPHYGDWAELEDDEPLIVGLAYYERYEGGGYGIDGKIWQKDAAGTETAAGIGGAPLKDDSAVVVDGYALAVKSGDLEKFTEAQVTYGNDSVQTWTLNKTAMKWTRDAAELPAEKIEVGAGTTGYTLFSLPDEVVVGDLPASAAASRFYQKLVIQPNPDPAAPTEEQEESKKTYYFNPHFAKTVSGAEPATEPATVSVRTPRHLYDMTRKSGDNRPYYWDRSYHFEQELDLDYSKYTGKLAANPEVTVDTNDLPFKQDPIGNTSASSGSTAFNGAYNGNCHTIKNVLFNKNSYSHMGLFGEIADGSRLKNIVYKLDPEKAEEVSTKDTLGYAGVLAGDNYGTIENCAVYGVNLKISSASAGGFVGCNEGTGTIRNCSVELASLELKSGGGGLAAANSGLIENSYAVGKILEATCGFVGQNSGTIKNCYAALEMGPESESTGKYGLAVGGTITDSYWLKGRFRYRGAEYSADYKDADRAVTPDELAEKFKDDAGMSRAAETVKNIPAGADYADDYAGGDKEFPYLTGVKKDGTAVHYGLWPVEILTPQLNLVYYEKYETDADTYDYGVYGTVRQGGTEETIDTLRDDRAIAADGYALAVTEKEFPFLTSAKLVYGNDWNNTTSQNQRWELKKAASGVWSWSKDTTTEKLPEKLPEITAKAGEKEQTYTLIPLPDALVAGQLPISGGTVPFYYKLTAQPNGEEGQKYAFNPHFAKTVKTLAAGGTLPQRPDGEVIIRTPRHLYNLTRLHSDSTAYYCSKNYRFRQELDLDYNDYEGAFADGVTGKDLTGAKTRAGGSYYKQYPIGKTSGSDTSFQGTYDGGYHSIRNIVPAIGYGDLYYGLFGDVKSGALKNIVYEMPGEASASFHDSGQFYCGALAGAINPGVTVDNCAVYGVNLSVSCCDDGNFCVGGLAGACYGTISNSAVEIVSLEPKMETGSSGSCYAGGMAGDISSNGGATIKNSYAVGRISCTNEGGGTICAGGFIGDNEDAAAVANCYAAVDVSGDAELYNFTKALETSACCYLEGRYLHRGAEYTLGGKNRDGVSEPCVSVDQLNGKMLSAEWLKKRGVDPADMMRPADVTVPGGIPAGAGYMADYKTGGKIKSPFPTAVKRPKARTNADGSIMRDGKGAVVYAEGQYEYVYYGLWPLANPALPEINLVYYEQYTTGGGGDAYGVYGTILKEAPAAGRLPPAVEVNTLENGKNGKPAAADGYALAITKDPDGGRPQIVYGTKKWTLDKKSNQWIAENGSGANTASVAPIPITGAGGISYTLYPLPDELVAGDLLTSDFYQRLEVRRNANGEADLGGGAENSKTFYFNPHFAKSIYVPGTAKAPEEPRDPNEGGQGTAPQFIPPDPVTNAESPIAIRTPRHLYDLTRRCSGGPYYCNKKFYFKQERELNYSTYTGTFTTETGAGLTAPTDSITYYRQPLIGTDAQPFSGTYDGGNLFIRNVAAISESDTPSEKCPLFAAADPEKLKNIRYEAPDTTTVSGP